MEMLGRGKIIKILDKDNQTPKHLNCWMKDITYYNNLIKKNYSALLFYNDGNEVIKTTSVEKFEEDENNLTIYTKNSIYYIKKYKIIIDNNNE